MVSLLLPVMIVVGRGTAVKARWYAFLQALDEALARLLTRGGSQIFLFHHIGNDLTKEAVKPHIALSQEEFILWLDSCLANGIEFRPLAQVATYTKATDAFITFDDIFSSAYERAIAILEAKNIPYTCFIALSYLQREGYASAAVVQKLACSTLCEIGAHTIVHPRLRSLSSRDAQSEIRGSKQQL